MAKPNRLTEKDKTVPDKYGFTAVEETVDFFDFGFLGGYIAKLKYLDSESHSYILNYLLDKETFISTTQISYAVPFEYHVIIRVLNHWEKLNFVDTKKIGKDKFYKIQKNKLFLLDETLSRLFARKMPMF